ncbi:MAG: response regulator transcription factor [Butyricicoccus sp.]
MLKVLIAEDEPLSLQNLSGQMRDLLGADALIEGVANGREAVERARQIQPQLVLMDIEMPVMNGLMRSHHPQGHAGNPHCIPDCLRSL